jgi:hypothetical protein
LNSHLGHGHRRSCVPWSSTCSVTCLRISR